jgi:arylamine N-acetyltransferase
MRSRVHVVNIVILPTGEKYVSDVAFGGDGPTLPLPLIDGHTQINLGTQEVRLIHSTLPHATVSQPNDKYWIYQYRNSPTQDWNSFYAFTEMEFFYNDFVVMNHYTSTFRGGSNWQTDRVLIVRFLKGKAGEKREVEDTEIKVNGVNGVEEEEERIVGKVMLVDGVVKRNDGGKTSIVRICETEEQRLEAMKQDFAMRLVDDEVDGIKGYRTELKEKSA